MSDDNGDADFEASLANLDPRADADDDGADDVDAAGGEPGEAVALDPGDAPGLASRLESVQGTLSTLGMRIDALVTSTTSYRTALTDRLTEYSELVAKTGRNQASDLDEYRKTAERAVGEVRRSMTAAEESMQRISARLDELATGTGAEDGESRRVLAEVRSILDAQERLSDFLTQSLDRFGASVVDHLNNSHTELLAEVGKATAAANELAQRDVSAPLAEDLAQIRAIAASIAERDVLGRLEAINTSIGELPTQSATGELREAIAELAGQVAALQSADPAGQVRTDLEPIRAGLDALMQRLEDSSGRDAVLARFDALDARIEGVDGRLGAVSDRVHSDEMTSLVDAVARRVEGLATTDQVRGLTADLRAVLLDSVAEIGGDQVRRELEAIREKLPDSFDAVLERLHETMLDVASGEVVGALWDEVRALRTTVEEAVGEPGGDVDTAARVDASLGPRLDTMRGAVEHLAREVRSLLDAVEIEDDDADDESAGVAGGESIERLTALEERIASMAEVLETTSADIGTLRRDLTDGLVVEPSSAIVETIDSLRRELVDGLVVDPAPSMVEAIDALNAALGDLRRQSPPPAGSTDTEQLSEQLGEQLTGPLTEQLTGIRSAIDDVHARLDEGLELAEGAAAPAPEPGAGVAGIDRLADQLASLRDLVNTRLQDLQEQLAAGGGVADVDDEGIELTVDLEPFEDAVESLREEVRQLAETAGGGAGGIDADTIDLLREEIRSAGGVSDEVLDALRDELKALRRRISVKADEKVLDDAQLAQIADAVAARLEQ